MHAVGIELRRELAASKCAVPIVDGPEPRTALPTHERIVISEVTDSFGPVRGQHRTTKHRMTRTVSGTVRIHAQSTAAGATVWEHRERAERILKQVLVGLELVAAKRHVTWSPKSGGFVEKIDDVGESPVPPGAVYELTFTIDDPVVAENFKGEVAPTAAIGGVSGVVITSTTKVSRAGAPDTDPTSVPDAADTACGGGD